MIKKLLILSTILLNFVGFSQNGIQTNSAPATASVGQSITTSFNYIASAAGTCQVQLFKTDSSGAINYSAGTDMIFTGPVAAAATSTLKSLTFTVSNTVMPTSTLPAGVVYKWFFKLSVGGVDYYGPNPTTTITPMMAVSSFENLKSDEMFVNSFKKSLIINTEKVVSESATIYDLSGRNIEIITDLKNINSFDLSNLNSGIYFVVTNDNKKLKFVL